MKTQQKNTKQPALPGDMRLSSAADRCLNTWSGTAGHRLLNKIKYLIKLHVQQQQHQALAQRT
jgi:hypothetical protein